jgi:hypothetical protein
LKENRGETVGATKGGIAAKLARSSSITRRALSLFRKRGQQSSLPFCTLFKEMAED